MTVGIARLLQGWEDFMRRGFVVLVICPLLTLASATGVDGPHDIYMALKTASGKAAATRVLPSGHYRTTANGTQMLVDGEWLAVPDDAIQYRALEGDTGETRGGHWCGLMTFGNHTYCAILPPTFGMRLGAHCEAESIVRTPFFAVARLLHRHLARSLTHPCGLSGSAFGLA